MKVFVFKGTDNEVAVFDSATKALKRAQDIIMYENDEINLQFFLDELKGFGRTGGIEWQITEEEVR